MISREKQLLRQLMRSRLAAMSAEERAAASARIGQALLHLVAVLQPHTVFGFSALSTEPNCLDVIMQSRSVALPRVAGDHLVFQLVDHNGARTKSALGVMEPIPDPNQIVTPTPGDLILVPGLAFDPDGRRLGRGRGYYDRFLNRTTGATRIGIAFACQIVKEIPREPHDAKLDHIISG